jgi:GNAT superfamily N-acetyltransferase
MSELESMYVAFRQEIDTYAAELIVNNLEIRPVIYKGKAVGFLILDDDYVDSFYIMPEFRKKGIGKEYIIGE